MNELNIKGKLVWYGFGMSVYFDPEANTISIYDVKTKIKIILEKMEDKQYEIKNKTINKR